MIVGREVLVLALAGVPGRFQLAKRPDDPVSGVDGVGARSHLAHVDRVAAQLDLEPEHAGVGPHQLLVLGFGDQHRVGAVAAQMGHQRPVAGRFLLDDRLEVDGGRRLQPETAQRVEGEQICGVTGLHVGAAAPV